MLPPFCCHEIWNARRRTRQIERESQALPCETSSRPILVPRWCDTQPSGCSYVRGPPLPLQTDVSIRVTCEFQIKPLRHNLSRADLLSKHRSDAIATFPDEINITRHRPVCVFGAINGPFWSVLWRCPLKWTTLWFEISEIKSRITWWTHKYITGKQRRPQSHDCWLVVTLHEVHASARRPLQHVEISRLLVTAVDILADFTSPNESGNQSNELNVQNGKRKKDKLGMNQVGMRRCWSGDSHTCPCRDCRTPKKLHDVAMPQRHCRSLSRTVHTILRTWEPVANQKKLWRTLDLRKLESPHSMAALLLDIWPSRN